MALEIEPKSSEEITAEMLAEVPDTYQKNVGYFIWDFLRAVSYSMNDLWNKLSYLAGFFDITKLDYDDLVKFVLQRRGIVAKTATYSTGLLTVNSGSGTITKGDVFETASGLQFEATETKEVGADDTFGIKCKTIGSMGNVPIGTITSMPTTIEGIATVTNATATSGGYDAETKESLIERYLDDLQNPISSANIYHYKKWAKECVGVGDAKIKPLWDGDNTVKIILVDSNSSPADSDLVGLVQEYIDPYDIVGEQKVGWGCGNGQAPIGAYCTVESATQLDIAVSCSITLKTGYSLSTVTTNIQNSINAYLKSTVFTESYVSYAKIGACILASDGVKDYSDLLVNSDNDNVEILEDSTSCEIAVLDDLTVTETEE